MRNSSYAYAKPGTIKSVKNISFIYPITNKNLSISTNGDEIQIQIQHNSNYTPVPSILISAESNKEEPSLPAKFEEVKIYLGGNKVHTMLVRVEPKKEREKNYNLVTPTQFQVGLEVYNEKGVEINAVPSSGSATFKVTSDVIPTKNQIFIIQYESFMQFGGIEGYHWGTLKSCAVEPGKPINCTLQANLRNGFSKYRYRVIRKSDRKVISNIITLAPVN